ncbi:hypothetical protein [Maribacter aestuarii]|uniref:hypothetical protein n=1 Tax=Maribacter aestuarii TaxID=1130723 RepID=UPI0025A4DE10|nr:hypothetical protein [Maribacter aestuarii]
MKNKRTFLASIALGVFLMAMAAPVVIDNQDLGINKDKFKKTKKDLDLTHIYNGL